MLVLRRRVGEEILINDGRIQVKVLHEHKGVIVIGINAPLTIDIDRKELFLKKRKLERIRRKKQLAAKLAKELWL